MKRTHNHESSRSLTPDIEKIRIFNRFYTNVLGVLNDHVLESPYSLAEARILYEINSHENCTAKKIRETITIDEGYLSRIIDGFVKKGVLKKMKSPEDARLHILSLTAKGRRHFSTLNKTSETSIEGLIRKLSDKEIKQMVQMMDGIMNVLTKSI